MLQGQSIEAFFDKKQILITGGTGFLGMSLVEKLLRSFPQIDRIYLLIRGKKSVSAKDRSDEYFKSELFSRAKEVNSMFSSKIEWLEGDVHATNLGLSEDVIMKLQKSLDIIIHSAALLNFKAPMKTAIDVNLGGTKQMLDLAKSCENIKCFLYVSTAYVNFKKTTSTIKEVIYQHPIDPEVLLSLQTPPELPVEWYNTYLYSKNAAENLAHKYKNVLPIGIYRPAIVTHSYKEPYPYWISGASAYTALMDLLKNGFVPQIDPQSNFNNVPVDMTVNGLLAAIVNVGINKSPDEIQIYNYTACSNPCTIKEMMRFYKCGVKDDSLSTRRSKLKAKMFLNPIGTPDNGLEGNDNRRMQNFIDSLESQFLAKLHFDYANIENLWDSMDEGGKKLLPFNIRNVNWERYYGNMYEQTR